LALASLGVGNNLSATPIENPLSTKEVPAGNFISKSTHKKGDPCLQLHSLNKKNPQRKWSGNKVKTEEIIGKRILDLSAKITKIGFSQKGPNWWEQKEEIRKCW
jgi:hypothetical protein